MSRDLTNLKVLIKNSPGMNALQNDEKIFFQKALSLMNAEQKNRLFQILIEEQQGIEKDKAKEIQKIMDEYIKELQGLMAEDRKEKSKKTTKIENSEHVHAEENLLEDLKLI